MADVIDAWTQPRILVAQKKADDATKKFGDQSAEAGRAAASVVALREELKGKYTSLELTPEEIETRFKDLRI